MRDEGPRLPLVICVAPNGARRTAADHPALSVTPAELAQEALRCVDAGAHVMHVHVRDDAGGHVLDPDRYRAAFDAIRAAVGERLMLQATTEAVGRYGPPEQMALVRTLCPEAVSIAVNELVPDAAAEPEAARFLAWARRRAVGVQYILYSPDDAARLIDLQQRGLVPEARPHALFVLGRYTAQQQSAPEDLRPFVDAWPEDWPWSMCAFGRAEAACAAEAMRLGGHVRVGFENNLHLPDGTVAPTNADLVRAVTGQLASCGRMLASPAQARALYTGGPSAIIP